MQKQGVLSSDLLVVQKDWGECKLAPKQIISMPFSVRRVSGHYYT